MRTRSSRFFVILLHLVGISHPSWMSLSHSKSGIVAVLPWPVALEQINLYEPSSSTTTKSATTDSTSTTTSISSSTSFNAEKPATPPPVPIPLPVPSSASSSDDPPLWLQDTSDGLCLGPTGTFSECGDATLWFVERRTLPVRNRLSLLSGGTESLVVSGDAATMNRPVSSHGLLFRVVDRDYETSTAVSTTSLKKISWSETRRQKRLRRQRAECLDADVLEHSVQVQSCRRRGGFVWQPKVRSSVWVVTEDGVLQPASTSDSNSSKTTINRAQCLSRGSDDRSRAILTECDDASVQFSFLRYRAVPVAVVASPVDTARQSRDNESRDHGSTTATTTAQANSSDNNNNLRNHRHRGVIDTVTGNNNDNNPSSTLRAAGDGLPIHNDRARSHASEPAMHPELKLASRLLFQSIDHQQQRQKKKDKPERRMLSPFLSNTNPILLADHTDLNKRRTTPSPMSALSMDDGATSSVRRLQTHPYLNEAKNGVWTDPQTGLEFFTDLCQYLGRDRKLQGRHTLTGVGIYRKGYVIKVYGVAYYVTKRDILADPSFQPYASLTADQLRTRPDFYEILRKMGDADTGRERVFDRTIMLKTNMQLSAETMRSSLQADWSYLTEESKRTLVETTMKARPADEDMLALIESPDNPSRCSCSQSAPPEYNANPDCCARGTELVFTWTKSNHLEVRQNGRLMESFPRPDIAEGIFYEYLRHDDPISPELRDNVVAGFPFLLGPLAQVRGVDMGKNGHSKSSGDGNALFTAFGGMKDVLVSHSVEIAGLAKRSALDGFEHASQAAKTLGVTVKDIGREVDRRRDLMVKHTVAAPAVAIRTVHAMTRWMSGEIQEPEEIEEEETIVELSQFVPRGRVFGYPLSRWFGEEYYAPDEIGPMKIHPTINRIILALVHLYLLLLFIVSFPGSYSTRTKLSIRKACSSRDVSDSESDISEDNGKACLDAVAEIEQSGEEEILDTYERRSLFAQARNSLLATETESLPNEIDTSSGPRLKKKSLSYFL